MSSTVVGLDERLVTLDEDGDVLEKAGEVVGIEHRIAAVVERCFLRFLEQLVAVLVDFRAQMLAELLQADLMQVQQRKDFEESHRFRQMTAFHGLIEFDIYNHFQFLLRVFERVQRKMKTAACKRNVRERERTTANGTFGWIAAELQ